MIETGNSKLSLYSPLRQRMRGSWKQQQTTLQLATCSQNKKTDLFTSHRNGCFPLSFLWGLRDG